MDTERKPVRITRKAITILRDNGCSYGGWAHFTKEDADPKPSGIRFKTTERVLFCPYCGEWTIYRRLPDDQYTWKCTGWCGWANTNDFYVKKENGLWGSVSSTGKRSKKKK